MDATAMDPTAASSIQFLWRLCRLIRSSSIQTNARVSPLFTCLNLIQIPRPTLHTIGPLKLARLNQLPSKLITQYLLLCL